MYTLEGSLEHTPHAGGFRVHQAPEVVPSEMGLRSVRSAVWNGFVFVDMSGEAGPFADYVRPTAERLAPVEFASARHDPEFDTTFRVLSNWKTVVENFVESYHVPRVHPALQTYNPMSAHFQILGGAHYAGQGGTAYGAIDNPEPMPGGHLPKSASLVAMPWSYESLYVFPNFVIAPLENMMFVIFAFPESAGVTNERICFFFHGDEAMSPGHRQDRGAVAESVLRINREDLEIIEACQRGRRSRAFVGGVFLPAQEATSQLVQRVFAGRMLEYLGETIDFKVLPYGNIFHKHAS